MKRFVCGVLLATCGVTAYGGKLDDFEKASKKSDRSSSGGSASSWDDDGDDGEGFFDFIFSPFTEFCAEQIGSGAKALGAAGVRSLAHSDDDDPEGYEGGMTLAGTGGSMLPFFRADLSYRNVESDIDALEYRLEAGYGAFALGFDHSHYSEDEPDDELDLMRIQALYRMSFGDVMEAGLGFGTLVIDGEERDSRFSFSIPVRYKLNEWVGFELRPAWSSSISDLELGLVLSGDFVSLKGGYRWVSSHDVSLDGAFIGVAVHY